MNVDVSVIVPTYNTPQALLEQALLSAAKQTGEPRPRVEIVVCDDGSNWAHAAMVRRAIAAVEAQHHVPILLTNHQVCMGPSAARNTAVRASSGRYLLWLDSDDVLHPQAVSRLLSEAELQPDSRVVLSDCRVYKRGVLEGKRTPKEYLGWGKKYRDSIEDPLAQVVFAVQAQLVARSTFEKVKRFDESLRWAEVTDLFLRIVSTYGIDAVKHIPFPAYDYRRRPRSQSTHRSKLRESRLEVLRRYAERESIPIPPEVAGAQLKSYRRSPDGAQHFRFARRDGRLQHPSYHGEVFGKTSSPSSSPRS